MTHTARAQLAAGSRFAAGRVTAITTVVSVDSYRNNQTGATSSCPAVTRLATICWSRGPTHVLSVIELHIEAFIKARRKRLERGACAPHIAMTDDAHRNIRGHKLREMTFRASVVTGEPWRSGVVASRVTSSAGQRRVALTRV